MLDHTHFDLFLQGITFDTTSYEGKRTIARNDGHLRSKRILAKIRDLDQWTTTGSRDLTGPIHSIRRATELHPTIEDFRTYMENNPSLLHKFDAMFAEIPSMSQYQIDPNGGVQVRTYIDFLHMLNLYISQGPPWLYSTPGQRAFAGAPINAALVSVRA